MGFWSTVGKIAPVAASFIPVVGPVAGAGLKALSGKALLSAGLNAAGSVASGMEKGREGENNAALERAMLEREILRDKENAHMGRADLELKQKSHALDARGTNYKDAMRSALAKNITDVSIDAPGVKKMAFSGGLRPSAMGVEGRAAADAMNRQSMEALLKGETFTPLPAVASAALPQYKKPGFFENLLGAGGAVGSAINQARATSSADATNASLQQILARLKQEADARGRRPVAEGDALPGPVTG